MDSNLLNVCVAALLLPANMFPAVQNYMRHSVENGQARHMNEEHFYQYFKEIWLANGNISSAHNVDTTIWCATTNFLQRLNVHRAKGGRPTMYRLTNNVRGLMQESIINFGRARENLPLFSNRRVTQGLQTLLRNVQNSVVGR